MCGGWAWMYSWCVGVETQTPVCVAVRGQPHGVVSLYTPYTASRITLKCQDLHSQHLYQWSILLTLILAFLDTALYVRGVLVLYGPWRPLSNWASEMLLRIGLFCSFKDQMWQFLQSSSMLLEDDSTGSHHMVFVICCGLKANRREWKHTPSFYLSVCGRHTRQAMLEIQRLNFVVKQD